MTPEIFLRQIVRPGLADLGRHSTVQPGVAAERFLVATALQESEATHRYQNAPNQFPGPARGWWQFESIAVLEMLTNARTGVLAKAACDRMYVLPQRDAVWRALEGHNGLATVFARLLVLTHRDPLPETQEAGWAQYISLWRPGKPHPDRWTSCWRRASEATLGPEVLPDADPNLSARS